MAGSIGPDACFAHLRLYAAPARCRGVGALASRRRLLSSGPGLDRRSCHAPREKEKPLDKVATVDPNDLQKEALTAAAEARTLAALNDVRIHYLGRSSVLKLALRNVRDRETGMSLNTVRETVEAALTAREEELAQAELEGRPATERVA